MLANMAINVGSVDRSPAGANFFLSFFNETKSSLKISNYKSNVSVY